MMSAPKSKKIYASIFEANQAFRKTADTIDIGYDTSVYNPEVERVYNNIQNAILNGESYKAQLLILTENTSQTILTLVRFLYTDTFNSMIALQDSCIAILLLRNYQNAETYQLVEQLIYAQPQPKRSVINKYLAP